MSVNLKMFLKKTIIGPSILINGRLSGEEDLTVRGRVEGEVALSRRLIVDKTGIVKANVSVKHAIISGVVVGNITATDCVELTPGGRMVGDIAAPRVIIVEGASFRGRVHMGDAQTLREARERLGTKPAATSQTSASARFSSSSSLSPISRPPSVPRLILRSTPIPLTQKPIPRPLNTMANVPPSPPSPPEDIPPTDALPMDDDDEFSGDKPLPPEPPAFMEANQKKVVLKKKK